MLRPVAGRELAMFQSTAVSGGVRKENGLEQALRLPYYRGEVRWNKEDPAPTRATPLSPQTQRRLAHYYDSASTTDGGQRVEVQPMMRDQRQHNPLHAKGSAGAVGDPAVVAVNLKAVAEVVLVQVR